MLGGAVAVLLVFGWLALGTPERLGVAPPEAPASESANTAEELTGALGREPEPGMLIVTNGRDPVSSGPYEIALEVLTSQVEADPEVATVRQGPVSEDELTTVLEVYFAHEDFAEQQRASTRIASKLDPGPLTVQIAGDSATLVSARRSLGEELAGLELLVLPLTILLCALVAGLRLVAAPLLAAALAVLGTVAAMRLLGGMLDLSLLGVAPAAAVGIALAIEQSLMLILRHRDDLESGGNFDHAVEHAVLVGGRPLVAASVGGALVPLALLAVPITAARSTAIGSSIAVLLAGAAALAVTPSVLVLAGPRKASPDRDAESERSIVNRLTGWVGERRRVALPVALATVAALLLAASPALTSKTLPIGPTALPADADARRADDRIATELGVETSSRATVSVPAEGAVAKDLGPELRDTEGVASVARPEPAGDDDAIGIGLGERTASLGARDAIVAVRGAAAGADGAVSGYDAAALDADDEIADRMPLAALIAAAALAIFVFALVRRPFLALGLGAASVLPAAAALGLLGYVFGDGRATTALDYAPQGAIQLDAVLALAAGVAAVSAARSAAYPVSLRGERAVAVRERPAEREARLALGPAGAGTAIAAAAAAVLVGSDVLPAKEAGLGLAAGLVLDLVALRVLLVPALGRLLQRRRA
jgi:putative drug exporter of the RND superfamily